MQGGGGSYAAAHMNQTMRDTMRHSPYRSPGGYSAAYGFSPASTYHPEGAPMDVASLLQRSQGIIERACHAMGMPVPEPPIQVQKRWVDTRPARQSVYQPSVEHSAPSVMDRSPMSQRSPHRLDRRPEQRLTVEMEEEMPTSQPPPRPTTIPGSKEQSPTNPFGLIGDDMDGDPESPWPASLRKPESE